MLLPVVMPYFNFNWIPKEETTVIQDVTAPKTFFESTDWEGLEEKDFELKLYNVSQPPFNPMDFNNHITSVSAYCSPQNDHIGNYEYDFNKLIDGTKYMTPHYDTTYGHSVEVELTGGEKFKIFLTSNNDNSEKQNIKDAFNKGNYFYFVENDIDKLLNIDMQGINFSTTGQTSNATPLLKKIIEQFGKPSQLNDLTTNQVNNSENKSYEMIYEESNFVLVFTVLEIPNQYGWQGDVNMSMSMSAKIFTPNSWSSYCNNLQKNN
jgi:hypothetical protein